MQEDNLIDNRYCNRIMILNIEDNWLSNSSDANPMENLWSIIKRRVEKRKATNLKELNKFLHEE